MSTLAPPWQPEASLEEMDSLQQSTKKCKKQSDTHQDIVEEIMLDANGEEVNSSPKNKNEAESSNSPKSFKEALLKVFGEEGLEEAVWSDLLDENLVEDRRYKDVDDNNSGVKTLSSGLVIPVSDEELTALLLWEAMRILFNQKHRSRTSGVCREYYSTEYDTTNLGLNAPDIY